MTKENYTHIATVVDRSGSMATIAPEMRGGLDSFFAEQAKLDGKCLVDYAQFDDRYELVYENEPVEFAKAVLVPRNLTALLDAIGKTVTNLGEKLEKKAEAERPDKVIVVVITDGHENASKEWNRQAVKDLITQQREKYNWEFVFLGATEDALAVADSYGFAPDSSLHYNTAKTGQTTQVLSSYVGTTRSHGSASFSDADRDATK